MEDNLTNNQNEIKILEYDRIENFIYLSDNNTIPNNFM